eukprot:TRINITY_DN20096_c0_g1_i1.p1 TRINITY_DN20096_c0_g1~~TRINITY_DN20096_c0_g1_i1.p1  ORF type:complete len:298 (-),score=40.47 TRINITY_DN20096_c0_g1_i1:112-936(-)
MASESVQVAVNDLGGREFEQQSESKDTVGALRQQVSESWGLEMQDFYLVCGEKRLLDKVVIGSLKTSGESSLKFQAVLVQPLPELGEFDKFYCHDRSVEHEGIHFSTIEGRSRIRKRSSTPDSSNVFLKHSVMEPCFVEFVVLATNDEMSFGVTYDFKSVAKESGFSNLRLQTTWIYSKPGRAMPVLRYNGQSPDPEQPGNVPGFGNGDRITVYIDPEEQLVRFYKNGEPVADNLPGYPLKAGVGPYRIYCMLDGVGDEVSVERFGSGEPIFED